MSFAFLPLYTGDYLRDTRHLTPLRHGVYLLLLMHCWDQRGPAPLDEQECAGVANCRSADEIEALRYVLARYFVRGDDGYYNVRMQREVTRAEVISEARSKAGKRGYKARSARLASKSQARAKQLPSTCQASVSTPTTTTTLTPTPTPTDLALRALSGPAPSAPIPDAVSATDSGAVNGHGNGHADKAARTRRLNAQAVEALTFLNRATGSNFRAVEANVKLIRARIDEYGLSTAKRVIVDRWERWSDDDKMAEYLRPATLFAARNFAQYAGQLPADEEMPS